MKQGVLAIYDKEIGYACQLMEYLNQKQDFSMMARVFTNLISLKDYLEENSVDLLLLGEDINMDMLPREQAVHIVILTERSMVREPGEYPYLYKFQSMENLVKELAVCYAAPAVNLFPQLAMAEKKMDLIGVFSPFGGCGKTLFSLALGQGLTDRKVLYIGMEPVSSFDEEENIRGNLSDIIYWIKERKEGCLSGISLMTEKRGRLDCIFSPDYFEDLNGLTEEDMEIFLNELYKNSTYNTVIFDIGCWNLATFSFLEKMDYIYMPDFLKRDFLKKEKSLFNRMKLSGKAGVFQKINRISIPFDEEIYQGNYSLDKLEKTKMGQYVCRIIKKDLI